MRIELYTCKYGLNLFRKGSRFGAWKEYARSFAEAEDNFKISVDIRDVEKRDNEDGAYDIMSILSVEVIK